jgi:hypothetical protein
MIKGTEPAIKGQYLHFQYCLEPHVPFVPLYEQLTHPLPQLSPPRLVTIVEVQLCNYDRPSSQVHLEGYGELSLISSAKTNDI